MDSLLIFGFGLGFLAGMGSLCLGLLILEEKGKIILSKKKVEELKAKGVI